MFNTPVSAWKEKIERFMNSSQYRELDRVDGVPMEFEWKIFPGFTTVQILTKIQNMMTEIQSEPEQCTGRIIFMSMYNDILWGEKKETKKVYCEFQIVAEYAKIFAHGHWSFLGPGPEKIGTEPTRTNRMENGIDLLRT